MKMPNLPAHDDFQKARTALLSTSIILFLLSRINLYSDTIDIFGLKIGVSKADIVSFWQLVVCYFTYVFVIKANAEWSKNRITFYQGADSSIHDSIVDGHGPFDEDIEKWVRRKNRAKIYDQLLLQLFPPIAIALAVLAYSIWWI